jgi:hypothetical protein
MADILNRVFALLDVKARAGVGAIFGPAESHGDLTLIPVASMSYALVTRLHAGDVEEKENGLDLEGDVQGRAMTRGSTRPVALIQIGPDTTRIRPIWDWNRIILAGVFALGWSTFLWSRVARHAIDANHGQGKTKK